MNEPPASEAAQPEDLAEAVQKAMEQFTWTFLDVYPSDPDEAQAWLQRQVREWSWEHDSARSWKACAVGSLRCARRRATWQGLTRAYGRPRRREERKGERKRFL